MGMDETEKYLFDLNGYYIIENAVPPELVDGCNKALDRFEQMEPTDYPAPLALGDERTEGNLYISNIMEGDEVFLDLMDLPQVLDVVGTVTGARSDSITRTPSTGGVAAIRDCTCTAPR